MEVYAQAREIFSLFESLLNATQTAERHADC